MKMPSCDCHKRFDFPRNNDLQFYQTVTVGSYAHTYEYDLPAEKCLGRATHVYMTDEVSSIELESNFCPECGKEYTEINV